MMLWLFPGQPLQRETLVPVDDDFQAIDRLCREHCGYDLFNHQPLAGAVLSPHTMLQLYGVALSLYRARRLRREEVQPDLIAEHSLGIYAALAASGSIGEGDALELACRIGGCSTWPATCGRGAWPICRPSGAALLVASTAPTRSWRGSGCGCGRWPRSLTSCRGW